MWLRRVLFMIVKSNDTARMIETFWQYDTQLFLWLNALGSATWDPFWLVVTNKWASLPLYLVLLYLLWQQYSRKTLLQTLFFVGLLVLASDQLANLFKYVLVQRPRPCRVEELADQMRLVADYCGRYGYFSAHAASSMAVAVFMVKHLAKHYCLLIWMLMPWALMVGYSRIYLGVHYPLDVLTGQIIGALLGLAFYRLQQYGHHRMA